MSNESTFLGHPWPYVSASQFKTYALCNRKWHIERFSGLPRPEPSPAMLLGTEVHELLEKYLTTGAVPEEGRASDIANAGIHLLPKPLKATVEGRIEIGFVNMQPPLVGFVDVYVPPEHTEDGIPEVIDHKTTSAWKWAKTEEQLRSDMQMIPYAAWALEESRCEQVRITHVQYLTKGSPEARRVSVVLTQKEVLTEWMGLVKVAKEMRETANTKKTEDVEGNASACGAFGGCPYQDICGALNKTKENPFQNMGLVPANTDKEKKMSRLQELLDRKREAQDAAPVTNGIVPPDAPNAPVATPAAAAPVEETAPPEVSISDLAKKHTAEQYQQCVSAIHIARGADYELTRAKANAVIGEVLDMKRVRIDYVMATVAHSQGTLRYDEDTKLLHSGEYVGSDEAVADAVAPSKPAKRADFAPYVQTGGTMHIEGTEPPGAPAPEPEPEPVASAEVGLTLYLDCFPMKGAQYALLEDVLAPVIEKVAEANMVPVPLLLDYGKGKDEVAGLMKLDLPSGGVVVSTKSPYWPALSATLLAKATLVIKGSF